MSAFFYVILINMIKVAITGNIASGKSQIENILSSQGFKVIDCDKVNHKLLSENIEVINQIKYEFGENILTSDNSISKQKLSEIIFNSAEKKKKLENILHKKILEQINTFFDKNKNEKIVFVSAALLFEANWQNYFDKIIFVSADEKIRLQRLIARNTLTKEQALKRIKSQLKEQEKIQKSDFVVYNNTDLINLKKSVLNIIKNL